MKFPDFYELAPIVPTRDPFAATLGAAQDGLLEYNYVDAVRLAGHSCPTVAGAFLMGRAALAALYPEVLPNEALFRCVCPRRKTRAPPGSWRKC